MRKPWLGPVLVLGLIFVGNAAYLTGLTEPDPLGPVAKLVVSGRHGFLPGQRSIDPNNGYVTQAIGRLAAHDLAHGHLPAWDPYEAVGSPLLASPQSATLFPPTVLQLLPNGLFLETLLLECIAGLATYALVRRLGVGLWPAVFGGVAFGLNGTFSWLQNGAMLPVAFVPLLLLGVERAASRATEGRRGGWCTIALALALMVHAGFLETGYIAGLLAAVWSIWRLAVTPPDRRKAFAMKVTAGVTAGAMLVAPLILPFLDYLGVADISGHSGALSKAVLPFAALPTQVGLPYAYGPIFAFNGAGGQIAGIWDGIGGFVTAAVVLLAVVGLFGRRLRSLRLVLAAWVALCLAKAFGPHVVVALVNLVPGMRAVAFYRYMNPSLELAAIVLATLGLHDLLEGEVSRRDLVNAAAVTIAGLWVGERLSAPLVAQAPGAARYLQLCLLWALAVVAVLTLGSLLRDRRWRVIALGTFAVADVVVAFGLPTLSAPRAVHIDTTVVTWLRQHDGLQRYYTFGPLAANYGSYYGVASVAATNVPQPKLWVEYIHRHLGAGLDVVSLPFRASSQAAVTAHPDVLRDLAVRYVVFGRGAMVGQPLAGALTLVHQDRLADVYELAGSRAYFDFASPGCVATAAGRTEVHVHCDQPAILIRREQFFPGWSASVNGRSAPIVVEGGLFQGVRLPAGSSVVRFSYGPVHFRTGLALAGLAVVWIVIAVLMRAGMIPRPPPTWPRVGPWRRAGAPVAPG